MNVVLFGATGMVGGGVLRECLDDPRVDQVVSVGRRPCRLSHPKLREVVVDDLSDVASAADEIGSVDACFYCIGVTAAGLDEEAYTRATLDLTLIVADALETIDPHMTFCFVSGQGADSTGSGRVMWARVKGRAENALLERGFRTWVFRPGLIQPLKGVRSRTLAYRIGYALAAPLLPVLKLLFPGAVTTTVRVGQAMITAAVRGAPKSILETRDINRLAQEA